MPRIDPTLQARADADPNTPFRVIVRVEGDLNTRAQELAAHGFQVTRQLRLIGGVAATATGRDITDALDADWIISIESDAPVSTL